MLQPLRDNHISYLQVLTKKKLQDLVREIDPNEQLDEDVEEVRFSWRKLMKLYISDNLSVDFN